MIGQLRAPVACERRVLCVHRAEVAITPAAATLYWHDERNVDPVDTQLRFDATVFNAQGGVIWQVLAPDGGPGLGTIDATGLYQSPDKGTNPSGTTDVVVATVRADRLRKAFGYVTLVGLGPAPPVAASIEIWPRRRALYYRSGQDNSFIDAVNQTQIFRATLRNSMSDQVRWTVDGTVQPTTSPWFEYVAPAGGGETVVTIGAAIAAETSVTDQARVFLRNYSWPGL